jgi:hypothetical protein
VLVCCNGNVSDPTCGGVNQELARWITPFRRGIGHWVTDVSPLLPLLVGDQSASTAVKCSFTMATDAWAMPWYPTLLLRLSSIPNAPLSSKQIVPLWNTGAGGNGGVNWGCVFDQKYNDGTCFPNRTVSIPSGATRAHIHSVITGHGSDKNNCAEFCETSHIITLNNIHIHEETFDNAGTNVGCTLATLSGALPNEHGTWPYGRDGCATGRSIFFSITEALGFSDKYEKMHCYGDNVFTTIPWMQTGLDIPSLANSALVEYCNNIILNGLPIIYKLLNSLVLI